MTREAASKTPTKVVETKVEEKKEIPLPEPIKILHDLRSNVQLLERTASTKDLRFLSRAVRQITGLRKRINHEALLLSVNGFLTSGELRTSLVAFVEKNQPQNLAMEVEVLPTLAEGEIDPRETAKTTLTPPTKQPVPEVEIYIHLLVVIYLIDNKFFEEAVLCSGLLVERVQQATHRRTSYPLTAKAYFYHSRAHELVHRLQDIRPTLLAAHQTACLRHDAFTQATLLNLLLRNYLEYNLYDLADKLISRTVLSQDWSNQVARYLYYQGRIKSMQLDYTDAHKCLVQAIRKAPQNKARGFRIAANKLAIIVQLLMGDTPDRQLFSQPDLQNALKPYFALTQAVRLGDLGLFGQVHAEHRGVFQSDRLLSLIVRLRRNVIKMGLRKISSSYSRISLQDVAQKLYLDVDGAELIVAKAIRDGVIDAVIDHDNACLQSREHVNLYATDEPQRAFNKRINVCIGLHNDAVKAMAYPLEMQKRFETAEERRERQTQEEELAIKLAEDDEDY